MSTYVKYTKEKLETIVKNCVTMADVCRQLGLAPGSGNQTYLKKRIVIYKIDTSHFLGQAHRKGKTFPSKEIPMDKYFLNEVPIRSHALKLKLIKKGIKEAKCEICSIVKWNNKQVPLELDHINGNHFDNTLNNLRIICPNCHAQTENYSGKNRKSQEKIIQQPLICESCGGIKKTAVSKTCSTCHRLNINKKLRMINPPFSNSQEVFEYASLYGYRAASRKYGLTDNGIRKRMKKVGFIPTKQYPKNLVIGINR